MQQSQPPSFFLFLISSEKKQSKIQTQTLQLKLKALYTLFSDLHSECENSQLNEAKCFKEHSSKNRTAHVGQFVSDEYGFHQPVGETWFASIFSKSHHILTKT